MQPIQAYKFTLKGMCKFAFISLYGRLFLWHRKPNFAHIAKNKSYLNLGCGSNVIKHTGGGAYHC